MLCCLMPPARCARVEVSRARPVVIFVIAEVTLANRP
jgi:hypothetical protein